MKKSNPFKIHSTLITSVGAALALAAPLKAAPLFSDPFTTADGTDLAAVNADIATRQTGTLANNAYEKITSFSRIGITGNQLVTGSDTGHYNYANFLPSLTTSPTNFTLSFDAKNTGTGGAWFSPFLTTHASGDLRGVSEFGLIIFQSGSVAAYGGIGAGQTSTGANTALVPDWNVSNMNHYDLVATATTANTGTYSVFINGVNVLSGVAYHLGTGVTPTAGHTGLFFAHRNLTNGGGTFDNVSLSIDVPAAYWDRNTTTAGACDALTPDTAPGTWGASDTHWNAVADGTGPTAAWTPGVTAVFAAGTDATGTYTVTVDGTQTISGLSFEEGTVSLLAGTSPSLTLNANSEVAVAAGLTATIATPLVDDGTARTLTKYGTGTLVLSGANSTTAASTMSISAGTVRFDSTSAIYGTGKNITVNANAVAMFGTLNNTDITTGLDRIVAASAGTIAADNNDSGNFDLNTAGLTAAYFGAVGSVNYAGLLTPNGNYRLGGAGGTLTMANANALTGSGVTLTVRAPGTVVLSAANDYTGATTVSGGILQVDGSLAAGGGLVTVATGGTLNIGPGGSVARDVTVSGGTVGLAGTISEAGTKLTLASGTVTTAAGSPTVATADFSAGTGTAAASTPLAITSTLKLPGGVTATLTGGTSFTATGANLANNSTARTLSLSGGTLALSNSTGPVIDLRTLATTTNIKASSYYVPDGRAPWRVSDWSGMTGTFPTATAISTTPANTMWLSNGTTGAGTWISWNFTQPHTIGRIHIWNYNEVNGAFTGRGVKTLTLETSTDGITWTPVPGLSPTIDWTNIGSNGTISGAVQSPPGGSTTYAGFDWILPSAITTQYLRFNNTQNFGTADVYTGLSEVVFYGPSPSAVNLPSTSIAATASSTLDMGTAGLNHTLGTLSIANGAQLTLPLADGAAVAFGDSSALPWDGTLNLTGTFVSGFSLQFGDGTGDGLLPAQLALITVNGGGGPFILDASGFLISGATSGYAAWAALNGAGVNFADDHDNDGVSNGVEYFLGGPTGNTTGFTPLPGVTNTGGVFSITWIKGSGYDGDYGTDFWVETSATLADPWTMEIKDVTVTDTASNVSYTFPVPLGTKNFARLKVIQQP